MAIFKGAGVAIVTPMNEDGSVNYEKFGELIEFQIANGTDAIIVCGTTGESSTLTHEEHLDTIKYCVDKVAKRIPVVAGTGSNCTDTAVYLSQEAEKYGVDGILLVSPYYNKATQKGLYRHFKTVADSVKVPAILYNVPSRTGCNLTPATLAELAKHPNINAVKEASGNISQVAEIAALCGDELNLYSGNDDQIIPLLALGALSEAGLFGIWDDLAGGIGLIALLVIIAAAVAIFMQCSASVRAYEFLQKQAIETEYGVTGLAKERRDAFAPQYDKANILGTVLCVLSAVPVFAAMMVGASFLVSASICLVLALVACGVYAFVRVGTVRDAMDQLLEEGDYTRPNKAIKSRINALTAAYWLVVVAIFLWYTFGPNGNGQPQYSWFIWAIAGVMYAALVIAVKAFMKKNR